MQLVEATPVLRAANTGGALTVTVHGVKWLRTQARSQGGSTVQLEKAMLGRVGLTDMRLP